MTTPYSLRYGERVFRLSTLVACFAVGALLLGLSGCAGEENDTEKIVKPSGKQKADDAGKKTADATAKNGSEASSAGRTGTLSGIVRYEGTAPEPMWLVRQGDDVKDAQVCAKHDIPDESLLVNAEADNGIANVFVYLAAAPAGVTSPPPKEGVEFDQKGCVFVPHALVVRVGQPVLVKSSDPIAHNVNTQPARNNPFNRIMEPNDQEGIELIYQRSERKPVPVKCDLHPWMRAYHLPLDHPFGTVTDKQGRFTIDGLPAGKHKLVVWHERADLLERGYEVEIQAGQTTEITLSYPAERFAR